MLLPANLSQVCPPLIFAQSAISLRQIREVRPQLLLVRLLPRGRSKPPREGVAPREKKSSEFSCASLAPKKKRPRTCAEAMLKAPTHLVFVLFVF
jgi:hypothetical protein